MAISLVQTIAPTAGTGNVAVSLSATALNSLLVIFASTGNETNNFISSITGGGNVFAQAVKSTVSSGMEIWYGVASYSITSMTVNFTGTSLNHVVYVREYTGVTPINPLDQTIAGTNSGTAMTTSASSPTLSNNQLVVVGGAQGSTTAVYTAGAGYGNLVSRPDATSLISLAIEDAIITAEGAQTGTMTSTVNTTNVMALATFLAIGDSKSTVNNNYQFFKVGDGASTTEKIR